MFTPANLPPLPSSTLTYDSLACPLAFALLETSRVVVVVVVVLLLLLLLRRSS